MPNAPWLVTGGAGYIGAHVVRALLATGREVVVVDDLSSGRLERLPDTVPMERASVVDTAALEDVLRRTRPEGVIHLAGKKFPEESVVDPLLYARVNTVGVISLLSALAAVGPRPVVFSSSCSVYGTPDLDVVDEDSPKLPQSPYGESKLYGEQVLNAAAAAYGFGLINLRYFNVVGAGTRELKDTSPRNLVPLVFRALEEGRRPLVFGADYPTIDGTCIRDYVDVEDLADAHVRAAEALENEQVVATYNVGRGEGSSVLDVLDAVRSVTGRSFEHEVVARRPGDPARIVGCVDRISRELGWSAKRTLPDMVRSAWRAEN